MSIFKTLLQSAARQIGFSRVFKAADAYDRWAEGYDQQADNLLVCLDDKVFTEMIKEWDVVPAGTGKDCWHNNPLL
jgi:hypothetical protein